MQSQPQCSNHWAGKSVCLHLNPSYLEKNRSTDVWVKEEGLEKGQRGSGTGGDKSPGRAVGPASHGISLRMCGSAWGEGEKAVDKPMEGNRVKLYSVGLSISIAKSYLRLSDGRFLLCFLPASPLLSLPIPSWEEGKGSFAWQHVLGGWVQLCWGSPLLTAWGLREVIISGNMGGKRQDPQGPLLASQAQRNVSELQEQ